MTGSRKVLILGFVALLAMSVHADVPEVSDEEFDSLLQQNSCLAILFFAPWCPHCKAIKPKFAEAADELAASNVACRCIAIDCTAGGKRTCQRYRIGGYPAVKVVNGQDKTIDYNGPREVAEMVAFFKKNA